MSIKTYDVIIIGGGIMGSATAYYLMEADPTLKVAVVERDAAYTQASTTLSMANVRIQFYKALGEWRRRTGGQFLGLAHQVIYVRPIGQVKRSIAFSGIV